MTRAGKDCAALPYVAVELNNITGQQGAMIGKVMLDAAFNGKSLRDGLASLRGGAYRQSLPVYLGQHAGLFSAVGRWQPHDTRTD